MKFRIVGDSCCDLTATQLEKEYFYSVPFTLSVGGENVTDDESFDQKDFLAKIAACPECAKSSCPSPDAYMECFGDARNIYMVTVSEKLSGSYNSAMLARQIFLEEHPDVNIHVFDSKSAAAGQHLICLKIEELALAGTTFDELVETVENYIKNMETVFTFDNLETMRKNGRLSAVKSIAANVLNIKPVLIGIDGVIHQYDQARGMNKALNKLLGYIEKTGYDKDERVVITECESHERCLNVEKILAEQFGFENIRIVNAGGLSTTYMNTGGVIVSFSSARK